MPKLSTAKKIAQTTYGEGENKVTVDQFELSAKTKDKDGKETAFVYQFPAFGDSVSVSDIVKALTYKNSMGDVVSGESVLRDYTNTALKNAARSSKLAEITGVLKMREDPEAAIKSMIDNMVIGFGVNREVAEANVRALIAQGAIKVPETAQPTA